MVSGPCFSLIYRFISFNPRSYLPKYMQPSCDHTVHLFVHLETILLPYVASSYIWDARLFISPRPLSSLSCVPLHVIRDP